MNALGVASWRKDCHRSAELRPGFAVVKEKTLSRPQRAMEAAQKNTSKTSGGIQSEGRTMFDNKVQSEKSGDFLRSRDGGFKGREVKLKS